MLPPAQLPARSCPMWFSKPLTGPWPFAALPSEVVVRGQLFKKTGRANPFLIGVDAQYRQIGEPSAHLKVHKNGIWTVDHLDCRNPDEGAVVEHALTDTTWGWPLAIGLGLSAGVALGVVLGVALEDG